MMDKTRTRIVSLGYTVADDGTPGWHRIVCGECGAAWKVGPVSRGVWTRVLQSLTVHKDGHDMHKMFIRDDGQTVIPGALDGPAKKVK